MEKDFINNNMTKQQLKALRERVNNSTDEQLSVDIENDWMAQADESADVDQHALNTIWQRIDRRIHSRRIVAGQLWRRVQLAATLLLPLLLFTTYYFYQQRHLHQPLPVTFLTGKGEQAAVILPDGSRVALNENSSLHYDAEAFGRGKREIDFQGEAYFEVHKDEQHPLVISSAVLSVKVLGTKFNLDARAKQRQATLALLEGSVEFSHVGLGKTIRMVPGQQAVLDRETGLLAVSVMQQQFDDYTAWRRKQLVFRDEPLKNVLNKLEHTYGVRVACKGGIRQNERFTGIIPNNNLEEDLEILKTSFHLKTIRKGNEVIMMR